VDWEAWFCAHASTASTVNSSVLSRAPTGERVVN
jgi:hypothetical protein